MTPEIVSIKLTDSEEIVLMRIYAADKLTIGKSAVFKKQDKAVKSLTSLGLIKIDNPERNKLISLADYSLTDMGVKFLSERKTHKQAKRL